MNSKAAILIQEKVSQSEPWNSTKGIYADFSDGFDKPKYYCRCPNCRYVHGHYKTPREAVYKRLCQLCHAKDIEKLKKQIKKSNEPVRPKKETPRRLFAENLVNGLLNEESPKDFLARNQDHFDSWDYWKKAFPLSDFQVVSLPRKGILRVISRRTGNYVNFDTTEPPEPEDLSRWVNNFDAEWRTQIGQHMA